ncbi:MAG: hypothetical protein FWC27_04090 [Firmicutes bacterium]|nr:hypothetical protein [Bacillota bacterium]
METFLEWIKWHSEALTWFATIIGALLGGLAALYQWVKQRQIRRTEFVYQIMQDLRHKKDIVKIRYMIEYDRLSYPFHEDNKLEPKVDMYLSILNYVCYLRNVHAISPKEFDIFRYTIVWTLKDKAIQEYLRFLYRWSKSHGVPCSFHYLVGYGTDKKNSIFTL